MAKQGFNIWHKLTTMWKTSWRLSHREIHDNPTTSKIAYDDIKEALLAKEWNSLHSLGKKLVYLHLKMSSNMNVNCTWSNYWVHHNTRSLLLTSPLTIDFQLKLDNGQLSLYLEILDYATFAPIMHLKMRHTLCWNVPYIASLEMSFHHYLRT